MGYSDDLEIIKNETGLELKVLLQKDCVFLCSSTRSEEEWKLKQENMEDCLLKQQLELLYRIGYTYYFIEWGDYFGREALQILKDMKHILGYPIWIIAVHGIGKRRGSTPDLEELMQVSACDGIVYTCTQQSLIRGLVSRCKAIVTENAVFYPSLECRNG